MAQRGAYNYLFIFIFKVLLLEINQTRKVGHEHQGFFSYQTSKGGMSTLNVFVDCKPGKLRFAILYNEICDNFLLIHNVMVTLNAILTSPLSVCICNFV